MGSISWEDPLGEEMATHFSILAWSVPWKGEPGRLQSMGLQRIRHDWSNLACTHARTIIFIEFRHFKVYHHLGLEAGEGNGNPLQYSCLENPMDRGSGRLQSRGSLRVGHDWATSLSLFTFMHWRKTWQPTPVFLPGESQGWGNLVGCHLWGHTDSDTTEAT